MRLKRGKKKNRKPWIRKSEMHTGCALSGLRPCHLDCLKAHGEECSMRVKWYYEFDKRAKKKKHKVKKVVVRKVDSWKIVEQELHGKKTSSKPTEERK